MIICSILLIVIVGNVNTVVEGLTFPADLQGLWRVADVRALRVTETLLQNIDTTDGRILGTFNCSSSFEETDVFSHNLNYLVINNVLDPNSKFCVKYKVDPSSRTKYLLVYTYAPVLGEPSPTADGYCKNSQRYPDPFIYIRVNSTTDCSYFDELGGAYQALVTENATKLCENDRDSLVHITDGDTLQMRTCVTDTNLPLKGLDLTCVGKLYNPAYIGALSISAPVVILVHQNRYYCSRVLQGESILEISLGITNYHSAQIKCERNQDKDSSVAGQFIALALTPYDCELGACLNGGTCTQQFGSYTCQCAEGFPGTNCETECDSSPCQNNGTCNIIAEGYSCSCSESFTGDWCETLLSNGAATLEVCASSPCQNEGTCVGIAGGYNCSCSEGYFGTHCETDVCASSPCQNGGTCVGIAGGYNCSCSEGYSGNHCQTVDDKPLVVEKLSEEDSSNEGSAFPIWIILLIIGVVAGGAFFIFFAKKQKKNEDKDEKASDEKVPDEKANEENVPDEKENTGEDNPVKSEEDADITENEGGELEGEEDG